MSNVEVIEEPNSGAWAWVAVWLVMEGLSWLIILGGVEGRILDRIPPFRLLCIILSTTVALIFLVSGMRLWWQAKRARWLATSFLPMATFFSIVTGWILTRG